MKWNRLKITVFFIHCFFLVSWNVNFILKLLKVMKMTKNDKSHVMSSTCNVSTAICWWNEHTATDLTCLSYSSKINDATVNHSCLCMTISASANLFPLNLFHMFYFCLFINSFSYISYEEALSCTFSPFAVFIEVAAIFMQSAVRRVRNVSLSFLLCIRFASQLNKFDPK